MAEPSAPKGLEGVIAAQSEMSYVNGIEGILEYVGIPIAELASNSTFEETAFLLLHKRLPVATELQQFTTNIQAHYELPAEMIDFIKSLPVTAKPMHVLRTCVSCLGCYDESADAVSDEALRAKGIGLIAKMPVILAYFDRSRRHLPLLKPEPSMSIAGQFLYLLNGEKPTETMERALDVCLILHADHGLNASTFAARVISSTMANIYGTISGAIGALHGPLHGGANERVMYMLREIGTADNAEAYLDEKIVRKDKIMGFGHRVYRTLDPRASFLKAFAKDLAEQTGYKDLYDLSTKVEEIMLDRVGSKGIYPNVDFYSATTYRSIGLEVDLFTPMFAVSRISGWVGHVLEQHEANRLIRPRAEYIGKHNVAYTPMEQRV